MLDLTLCFSYGMSLHAWDKRGMFSREVALYRRLREHGVPIRFITYGDSRDLHYAADLPGIQILPNRWRLRRGLYALLLPLLHAPWLQRTALLKTNQTDGALAALRAAQVWRRPLIARCGYMWSQNVERRQGKAAGQRAQAIERQVFTNAQQVVVTTQAMADDIRQRIPAAAGRVRVIPNYVDTDLFAPAPPTATPDIDLLFIGRLTAAKNLDALLAAVQPLNIRTMLIGAGEEGERLQRQFPSAQMQGRLEWAGSLPNHQLPDYLRRARVFILPSHYEGHPKALIEAMACGLPVIGTDVPGIRDLLRHGETGALCPPTPEGIREAVQTVLAVGALQARLGGQARQFVLEHFSLDRVVEQELDMLRAVYGG